MILKHLRMYLWFLALLGAATQLHAQQATRFHDRIVAMAGGADSAARRQTIVGYLEKAGVDYKLDEFKFPAFSGTNIVAEVPGRNSAAKTLLLGAHYDRVAQGQGAVDNAASCAVLIELLTAFKAKPLEKYSIRAVFFDLEEGGLVGSQAYIAKIRASGLPALAVNLDIFAYGDTFFANPSAPEGPLATALRQAAEQSSVQVRFVTERNQYPASDHRPMMAAGIETVGLALLDGKEIEPILQHQEQPPPHILTIIHTPKDTIDEVRAQDMEKGFTALEKALRLLDPK